MRSSIYKKCFGLLSLLIAIPAFGANRISDLSTNALEIGSSYSAPDASSVVDIRATGKGMLPPRMPYTTLIGISAPAEGLIGYDTTNHTLDFWNGTSWQVIPSSSSGGSLLASDWKSANSHSINGGIYSAIYVQSQPAAGFAAFAIDDETSVGNSPVQLSLLGSSTTNPANGQGGGELDVIAGNSAGIGPGGLLYLQGGTSVSAQGGNIDIFSGTGGTVSGNVLIGPGDSSGKLQFTNVNEGTIGNIWVETDTSGSGQWGAVGIAGGGTGFSTYTLGDTLYASATNTLSKLPGNTTSTKKFLTQTGTGSVSAAPGWNTIANSDLPSPLLISNGTVSAPGLAFSSETNSGMYRIGTGHWGMTVSGTEVADFNTSSPGGYGNVGLGGVASVSDFFPFYVNRSIAGTVASQFNNPDTSAQSGTKLQVVSDNSNNVMEISSFTAATFAPDAYNGGRGIVRCTGSLAGCSIVADAASNSDIKLYAGGNGSGDKIATINSSGITDNVGGFIGDGHSLTNLNIANLAGATSNQVLSSLAGFGNAWTTGPTLGVNGGTQGSLILEGSSSGAVTIQPGAAGAGTYNFNLPTGSGSSGQPLLSGGGGSTAQTYGTLGVAAGGTGQTSYTDGQLLIGNTTGNTLAKATLSAGTGINITNGHGTITIANTGTAGSAWNYTSQTTTYSATINDFVVASGASFTITLPTAVGVAGQQIGIKHADASETSLYTINTTSSQTINDGTGFSVGSGNYVLHTSGETLILVSDGANWQIAEHKTTTKWYSATPTVNNFGTISGEVCYWRRVGSVMEIQLKFVAGTPTSGGNHFQIPLGVSADTTNAIVPNGGSNKFPIVGVTNHGTASVGSFAVIDSSSNTFINCSIDGHSTNNASSCAGVGDYVSMSARVPIVGWQP